MTRQQQRNGLESVAETLAEKPICKQDVHTRSFRFDIYVPIRARNRIQWTNKRNSTQTGSSLPLHCCSVRQSKIKIRIL